MPLDADEVRRLLADGEGSRIEFKSGLPRASKVARTLAAFANTRGGAFLVGIDDRGRIVGAPKPRATAAALREIAREHVRPPLALQVRTLRIDGLPVVAAEVGLSPDRPHAVRRENDALETPIRVGSSTRAARGAALEGLRRGAGGDGRAGLDALERRILDWIARQGDVGTDAAGGGTPQAFARSANVGVARARRAFVKLERAGRIVGYGAGAQRSYAIP
jgi:hypothetical protein